MNRNVVALFIGAQFGFALALSGMTDPLKILGFLDVTGSFDPTLLFVLGGALTVTFIGYRLIRGRHSPVCDTRFHLPTATAIDMPLLTGAAVFGIGWGLAGYCPGPALAALACGRVESVIFVVAMFAGMAAAPPLQDVIGGQRA